MELSPVQKEAVGFNGSPTLVVSGAGSGKTTVLTNKVANLIQTGFDSKRILAITFTNKAADEMKTRLVSLTGMTLDKFPWVRTYHSACFKILSRHCGLMGYKPPVQIYDSYYQQKLIKEMLIGMNFDKKHVPAVAYHISRAKNTGSPEKYFDQHRRVAHLIPLAEVFKIYEEKLLAANVVDFDNILLKTRDLLRDHKDVREYYQNLFQYILCDEFQDTNPLQGILTDLLVKNGNLFCVGDDWQSIYQFRGSDVNQFLSFPQKYQNAKIFRLEQNYRSADEIVQLANRLIQNNRDRMEKTCFSEKRGGLIELRAFDDAEEEAAWVARKIRSLSKMGIPQNKIGVLYRVNACSRVFEGTFRKFNIPYQILGSRGFFERKEILDINAYLKSSVFPKDDVSFERVITLQQGIGKKTVEKIGDARTAGMSLQDAVRKVLAERVMSKKIHATLSRLIQLLDTVREMKPDKAIQEILSGADYWQHLEKYTKSVPADLESRKENIRELIWLASKKETLPEYFEEVSLVQEDKQDEDESQDYSVKLSSVHASKGLEYHAVFIIGCEAGLFPHWRSTRPGSSDQELQEERRLMYVAVTRAEKYLFISHARYRSGQYAEKSRFWKEIKAALE
jgi:DNA helicase-2/ATP-dependent DNA helicase PcrA